MNRDQFKQRMQDKGYGNAEVKTYGPDVDEPMHTHDVSVMALVLSGELTLAMEDGRRMVRAASRHVAHRKNRLEWCKPPPRLQVGDRIAPQRPIR
jgi:hypothetical protein